VTNTAPLDSSLWDAAIPIGEDFDRHVNARWLAENPVPPMYPMWGAYLELDHGTKELARDLLVDIAAEARVLAKVRVHAPSRFRVNGPLANTPAVPAAFGIAEGSPMALPAERRVAIR
jgi:predicted metalloendopeptidase